jgi:hypothetical protein
MAPRKAESGPGMLTTEKIMQTFRMPRELVGALRQEANRKGLDLTALVVRLLHGYLTHFGLPEAATTLLEADREALRMDREAYVLHLLFQRALELREKGPGFDAPKGRKGR